MLRSWQEVSTSIMDKAHESCIPISGAFELTGRCNLNCKMCYVHTQKNKSHFLKELSTADWLRLGKEAADMGMFELLLTGGEVFLREDFREIYEGLCQFGLLITIYSNGTLINQDIASWLSKLPPKKMEISLYGASQETYKRICGDAFEFDRVIGGIKLLKEAGIRLELRTTLLPDNIDDFEGISAIADSLGLKLGIVNYICPKRDLLNKEQYRLTPIELVKMEDKISNFYDHKYREDNTKRVDGGLGIKLYKHSGVSLYKQSGASKYKHSETSMYKHSEDSMYKYNGSSMYKHSESSLYKHNRASMYKPSEASLIDNRENATTFIEALENSTEDYIEEFSEKDNSSASCAYTCTAGTSSFSITYDGRMTPCGLAGEPFVHPLKLGFKEAWFRLREKCCAVPKSSICSSCDLKDFCITCPTRLLNETGSFEKGATYLCELARAKKASLQVSLARDKNNYDYLYKE